MKTVLGRKQATDNALWVAATAHIEDYVTREELAERTDAAATAIREHTDGKRAAFAWSGGKDSIVLADICRKAGITDCVFAHSELEYPAFLAWCLANRPEGCEVINVGLNLDWLSTHQEMLFPKSKGLNRWYQLIQRKAFTQYFFTRELDMLLVGHRRADGNVVGPDGVVTKKSGETRYAPLADWPHELILAYIHYHGLPLPPIYGWKNGYRCGTHPWPSRMYMGSAEQGYREVYEIDPEIVVQAAEKLSSARHFLEGVKA